MRLKLSFDRLIRLLESQSTPYKPPDSQLPPPSSGQYMTTPRSIKLVDRDKALESAQILARYLQDYSLEKSHVINEKESQALEYFQFLGKEENTRLDSYGWGDADFTVSSPHVTYTISVEKNLQETKPTSGNIIDHIIQLRELIEALIVEIKKSDNQIIIDGDIGAARAYMQAFSAFLDSRNTDAVKKVPVGLVSTFMYRIKKVDWGKVSSTAASLASSIEKIMNLFR